MILSDFINSQTLPQSSTALHPQIHMHLVTHMCLYSVCQSYSVTHAHSHTHIILIMKPPGVRYGLGTCKAQGSPKLSKQTC